MSRMTSKTFLHFINSEFKRLEMPEFEAFEVNRTRFRMSEYEAGACKLIVRIRDKRFKDNELNRTSLLCFYSLKEYEEYLKSGYKMYLKFNDRNYMLNEAEIDVKKSV